MQGNRFAVSVHIHGTLAANAKGNFMVPCACSLEGVSLCNSANSDMILDVGTSADVDGILADKTGGDSDTPTLFGPGDFNGALATAGEAYHMADGTIVDWDLDYDGASGTASANVAIVFYFLEG